MIYYVSSKAVVSILQLQLVEIYLRRLRLPKKYIYRLKSILTFPPTKTAYHLTQNLIFTVI